MTLPLPPSVNQCYGTDFNTRRRFKTAKYKEWEEEAAISYLGQKKYKITGDRWLIVKYLFYMPLYTKKGKIKKNDLCNREKALSDWIGGHVTGFEDSKILEICMEKINSERNEVEVFVKEC